MNTVLLLLPVALLLGAGFLGAFIWCAAHGQYDDLETPAHRILLNDSSMNGATSPQKKESI